MSTQLLALALAVVADTPGDPRDAVAADLAGSFTIPKGGHGDFSLAQYPEVYDAIFAFLGARGLLPAERPGGEGAR